MYCCMSKHLYPDIAATCPGYVFHARQAQAGSSPCLYIEIYIYIYICHSMISLICSLLIIKQKHKILVPQLG